MTTEAPEKIRIVAINGSVRPGNYTGQALAVVCDELRANPNIELIVIDPADWPLQPAGLPGDADAKAKLDEIVAGSTGLIISTPEYHGSYSAMIKIVIESLGFPSVIEGKPVVLVGVAAGAIGAIKALEHLRSVCSHVGGLVLPGPVSVAQVHNVFDDEGNCTDETIERRLRGAATKLVGYIANHICPSISLEEMVRQADSNDA